MRQAKLVLIACIVVALTGTSALAQPVALGARTTSSPARDNSRVTRNVDARDMSTLARTHAGFLGHAITRQALDPAISIDHLQVIFKRTAERQAALNALMDSQHNPSSPQFRHWLTAKNYGESFGVADGDIEAVASWLNAEGFKINAVYPNRMQIDFSGNVGQVNHAFHINETRYTFVGGSTMVANDQDVSVPAALHSVIAGISGLSRLSSKTMGVNGVTTRPNTPVPVQPQTITDPFSASRVLVPNDLVTMYGMRTLRNNGVVGTGTTVALVEAGGADSPTWSSFANLFNLSRYGGTLTSEQPQGPSSCAAGDYTQGSMVSTVNAEWITAMAPGANVVLASCADSTPYDDFSGIYAAATNLVNAESQPNIIDVDFSMSEVLAAQGDRLALDLLWEQADAEGISVFVPTGDAGPSQMVVMYGPPGLDINALAASTHVTAVGGTDLADKLDGTTREYFAPAPSAVGGTALSYIPEIPWNQSCGNGVVAKHLGFNRVVGYCNAWLRGAVTVLRTSVASGGGSSNWVAKPGWQASIYNAAQDQSRDIPDVALFAGSYDGLSNLFICIDPVNCNFTSYWPGSHGTSLSTAMFAGIQAVMDEGLSSRGYPRDQGNAAPTLYALAAKEYGQALDQPPPPTLAACNADNGAAGTANCIFHNVTRGATSDRCIEFTGQASTTNCFFYATVHAGADSWKEGLSTTDENPTSYTVGNKAYSARPGWSFASGLGSVNATNLLIAWRAFAKTNEGTL